MAHYSQRHNQPYSNGCLGWEQSRGFNPKLSSHTSLTCGQHTWTPTSPSQPVNPHCFNVSYGALKGTWASTTGAPSCQSCAPYSGRSWKPPPTHPCSAGSISKPQLPQHSRASSDAGNLQCEVQEPSTRASTSQGAASNSAPCLNSPLMSSSQSPHRKLTPSGREWLSPSPVHQGCAPAQCMRSKTSCSMTPAHLSPH